VRFLLAGLLLAVPAFSVAQTQTDSVKSAGSFTVQIVLTADAKAFRNTWNTSETPPRLETTSTVKRGGSITAMLVVHGCAAGREGKCNATARFDLVAPDGKKTPGGSGVLWNAVAEKKKLYLSDTSLTIGFDAADELGKYRIVATATDRVARRTIEVSAPFTLR
jgi:hypothetical protein